MASKPKTGGTAKKAVAADKQKAQSARFIEAAREHGVDETGKDFEKTLTKIFRRKSSRQ